MRIPDRLYTSILLLLCLCWTPLNLDAQSPKKLLENGYYEQAFVDAVYKQNKKVKLKPKFTDIIYASYDKIYAKQSEIITSAESNWQMAYNALIRTVRYRAKVKHPGVYENLKNMLYDSNLLDHLGSKFNQDNQRDLADAQQFEIQTKFDKAMKVYKGIEARHKQALEISTLKDRILIIDYEEKIKQTNRKIGDQYIKQATEMLGLATAESATKAIDLINLAKAYRPLSAEEEGLLDLAHIMRGNSWMQEAQNLMKSPTKKNARLAYELIEKVRKSRTLTPEEERLAEQAEDWGMTRILVKVKGTETVHSAEELSGFLNKSKRSKWIAFYHSNDESMAYDFEMVVTENKPTVTLGKRKKEIKQHTKTVEYWEDETDDQGNTTSVKKTRQAVAIVAEFSRTKTALLKWSVNVIDLTDGKVAFSESTESKIELTNQFAKLESGDVLAMPQDIETEVDLDSQPFPTNEEMLKQVKDLYLNDLNQTITAHEFH